MGRKRPPGSKRRGPTEARRPRPPVDPFSMDPEAVMYRLANLKPIAACLAEHEMDVLKEVREFLNGSVWDPPLPENFSLMAVTDHYLEEQGQVVVCSFGLPDVVRWAVAKHLEEHEQREAWNVWDAVDYPQGVTA